MLESKITSNVEELSIQTACLSGTRPAFTYDLRPKLTPSIRPFAMELNSSYDTDISCPSQRHTAGKHRRDFPRSVLQPKSPQAFRPYSLSTCTTTSMPLPLKNCTVRTLTSSTSAVLAATTCMTPNTLGSPPLSSAPSCPCP